MEKHYRAKLLFALYPHIWWNWLKNLATQRKAEALVFGQSLSRGKTLWVQGSRMPLMIRVAFRVLGSIILDTAENLASLFLFLFCRCFHFLLLLIHEVDSWPRKAKWVWKSTGKERTRKGMWRARKEGEGLESGRNFHQQNYVGTRVLYIWLVEWKYLVFI